MTRCARSKLVVAIWLAVAVSMSVVSSMAAAELSDRPAFLDGHIWFMHTGGAAFLMDQDVSVIIGDVPQRVDGTFRVKAHSSGGDSIVLWEGPVPATFPIPGNTLSPGTYDLLLEYVQDGLQWSVTAIPLRVIAGQVKAVVSFARGDGLEYVGTIQLTADGPVDLDVRLASVLEGAEQAVFDGAFSLHAFETKQAVFSIGRDHLTWPNQLRLHTHSAQPIRVSEEIQLKEVAILTKGLSPEDIALSHRWRDRLHEAGVITSHLDRDAWLSLLRKHPERPAGLILLPSLDLVGDQQLLQSINQFARNGGDLLMFGHSAITLAREDVGIGLPIMSSRSMYSVYDLDGSTKLVPVDQGVVHEAVTFEGEVQGHAAVGYVYPNASWYFPVLDAQDDVGRSKGFAAGVLVHYDGPYTGGQWFVSGVTTREVYQEPWWDHIVHELVTKFDRGELIETAKAENARQTAVSRDFDLDPDTLPTPRGFVRVSDDGRHLLDADGQRLFMIGANYAGPFGYGFGFGDVNVEAIEADFKKARDAGVNAFRIWSLGHADDRLVRVIKYMARKYGIYLLIVLPHPQQYETAESLAAHVERIARSWHDEPMVIGYDFANEPDIQQIGGIRYGGERTPVLELNPAVHFADVLNQASIEDQVKRGEYPGFPRHTTHEENVDLRTAREIFLGPITGRYRLGGYSTFPEYEGSWEIPTALKPLHDAVNDTYQPWIDLLATAIGKVDQNHLITVGYDQIYALLPANAGLDFVSHHVYQRPTSLSEVQKNLTTMDRLRLRWPKQPISLGEFGYSSGYAMPDGRLLDPHTASVGEMMVYLYGLANEYSGAYIWLLNERPVANMRHNEMWMSEGDQRYEERFGLYHYGGDDLWRGVPKPIAMAMGALGEYVERHRPGSASFKLVPGGTRMGAGYVFQGEGALFIGGMSHASERISFESTDAANVVVFWDESGIRVMSTADARIELVPARFMEDPTDGGKDSEETPYEVVKGTSSTHHQDISVVGNIRTMRWEADTLIIDALAGEWVNLVWSF